MGKPGGLLKQQILETSNNWSPVFLVPGLQSDNNQFCMLLDLHHDTQQEMVESWVEMVEKGGRDEKETDISLEVFSARYEGTIVIDGGPNND